MLEDDPVRAVPRAILGENLNGMSIGDLEERVEALKAEIARTEAVISSKRAGRAAADAVFGRANNG